MPTHSEERTKRIITKRKILRRWEVLQLLQIANATLYDWLSPKSPRYDPTFPKQIRLGASSVGWLADEIDAWIERRKEEREVTI